MNRSAWPILGSVSRRQSSSQPHRPGGRPRVLDKEKIRFAEAMLKDTVNYPFVGDVIDHLRIGRTAFYRYFPQIVSVNSGIMPERRRPPVSFYVPLSK
jgi:hypothetical protein